MLEGMVPYFKRALVVAVILCALFAVAQSALAGSVFPPGGPPPGFDPTPSLPNNPTPDTEPPIFPGDVGTVDPSTGQPISGVPVYPVTVQPIPGATETTQTVETPAVTVDHGSCQWDSVQGGLYCLVLSGFGSLASLAGWLFDFAVREFIIGFGTLYLNTGVGVILENLWGTVRDIFNLTFIFGLVYIGFQIILGVNEAGAKRTIPYLILAALLVNFSLFIVKFIIDFTNYAAAQVYGLFRTENVNTDGIDISRAFLNSMEFSNILGASGQDAPFLLIIGTLILFLVLFYVFLSGAIMIMIRFIALCFYMIFSPIMFLGWVFPGMGSYTKEFWRGLLGQAFFAPVLLFLLYLSISVIIQFREGFQLTLTADNVGTGGSTATVTEFLNLVPFFVLSIGFIIASLVVAKKIGFTGGGMAISMAEKARGKMQGYVGGAAFGAAAMAGRNTLGVAANNLQNSERMKDLAARGGRLGKMAYSGVGKVADSSMDARKVGGLGKKLGVGEGRKGGIATIVKEQKEADEKFLKALGTRSYDDTTEGKAQLNAIANLKEGLKSATDPAQKAHMEAQLIKWQGEYDGGKKKWGPEEEYKYQLNYINALEKWQKWQKFATTGATVLAAGAATGGIGLAAGVAAGTVAGTASMGSGYRSKKSAAGLRKDYGKDGSKKKKSDTEKKAREQAAVAMGIEQAKADHGKAEKAKEDHSETPKATPKASAGGGGNNHPPTVH